jgi:hypothetical protein
LLEAATQETELVERKSQFYSKTDTLRMEGLSSSKLQLGTSGTGRAFIRRCVEQDLHKPGCVAFFFFCGWNLAIDLDLQS